MAATTATAVRFLVFLGWEMPTLLSVVGVVGHRADAAATTVSFREHLATRIVTAL